MAGVQGKVVDHRMEVLEALPLKMAMTNGSSSGMAAVGAIRHATVRDVALVAEQAKDNEMEPAACASPASCTSETTQLEPGRRTLCRYPGFNLLRQAIGTRRAHLRKGCIVAGMIDVICIVNGPKGPVFIGMAVALYR